MIRQLKYREKVLPDVALPFHTVETLRLRTGWYINLRWIAVLGLIFSIPVGEVFLEFRLSYPSIIFFSSLTILINLFFFFIYRYLPYFHEYIELGLLELQIIIDLIIISFLIHFSGGIDNPFFFLYIVQVILSGILFPGALLPFINAVLAAFLLTLWTLLEHTGAVYSYTLEETHISNAKMITALSAFYITNFAGIYIIYSFMKVYRSLKKVIDTKSQLLEQSIEDRNKAFRYAAHELKSPMSAIKITLETIKEVFKDELKPEVKGMIFRAEKRSEQVLNMVKEIIAITQYNLGMDKPVIEKLELNNWLSESVALFKTDAMKKEISLTFKPLHKKLEVEIDKPGMEKIIVNLISNAIRYTPDGGEVSVECFSRQRGFGFSVRDNGIGLEKDELEKIFDEFYRSKKAKEMEQLGTGLGLNLVKEIVRINNGAITVDSTPGKGSIFTVELPYKFIVEEETEEDPERLFFLFE